MLPGLLVGCSGGQQGAAPTEPTAGSDPAKPAESAEPTAEPEPAKPVLPMTVTVEIEDGTSEVTLQSVNWDATSEDEPAEGNKLVTALYSFSNIDAEEFEPYRAFEFLYRAPDGETYETSDAMVEKDLFGTGSILQGESIEGNVVFEIPASSADDVGTFLLDVDGAVYGLPLDGSGPVMPTEEAPSPEPTTETPSATPTEEGPGETVVLTADSEGDGPAVLDSPFATLNVPGGGTKYEVSTLNFNEENGRGVLVLYIRTAESAVLDFEVSTTRMVSSLDDVVVECERVNSFNGVRTPTRGSDVVFNGVTYATVLFTDGDKEFGYYVTYYEKDGINHYVEMEVPVKDFWSVSMDDPRVVGIMENIVYKK